MKKAAKGQRITSLRNKYLSLMLLLLYFGANSFAQSSNNNPKIFNVKMFGAKGDGTTNDVPAIQSSITACYKAKGGVVYFPFGIYLISDTLVSSVTFAGGI